MSSSWDSNSSLVSSEPWVLSWKLLVWMEVLSDGWHTSNKLETYDHQGLFAFGSSFSLFLSHVYLKVFNLLSCWPSVSFRSCRHQHHAALSIWLCFQKCFHLQIYWRYFSNNNFISHLSFPLTLCLVTRTILKFSFQKSKDLHGSPMYFLSFRLCTQTEEGTSSFWIVYDSYSSNSSQSNCLVTLGIMQTQ